VFNGSQKVALNASFSNNTWTSASVILDFETDTQKIWINDEFTGTFDFREYHDECDYVDKLQFHFGSWPYGTAYVDAVHVSEIAEPEPELVFGKEERMLRWEQNITGYEGQLVANLTGMSWQGISDVLFVNITDTSKNCEVNNETGKTFLIESSGTHIVACEADAKILALNKIRSLRDVVPSGILLMFLGDEDERFLKTFTLFGEGEQTIQITDMFNKTIYSDSLFPEITLFGPTDLISYSDCVFANFSANFSDAWLSEFGMETTGQSNINKTFCSIGNYTISAWANDTVGHMNLINKTIQIGNASYQITTILPVQQWRINQTGPLEVIWETHLEFILAGWAKGNLSFLVETSTENKSYNFSDVIGPWSATVIEPFSNQTIDVNQSNGLETIGLQNVSCMYYNLSSGFNSSLHLKAEDYNPVLFHSKGFLINETLHWIQFVNQGLFYNNSWWVNYEGNKTKFKVCTFPGKEPSHLFCGDRVCNNGEGCSICATDCGICQSSGSSNPETSGILRSESDSNNTEKIGIIKSSVSTQNKTPSYDNESQESPLQKSKENKVTMEIEENEPIPLRIGLIIAILLVLAMIIRTRFV
ncbi:MAG: hypothetical protein GOU99_03905, partial [Candidatus Altiarchaeota archaeon]|nr:hypothetical protein [Candidatus Altiarchaeota archaeon]